jgi:HK97 family phage prohead protease
MTDLFRSAPAFQVRAAADDNGEVTLFGHFARFGEWTEIYEFGQHFMERIAPGAFKKTIQERSPKILFQHGLDPEVGKKPIAEVRELREDGDGAYYEARLFDGLPPLIAEGLRAGQYGASFQFAPIKDTVVDSPARSDHNPDGLPEVTRNEVALREFGPVTFGAYDGATAGIRSLTDDFLLERLQREQPEHLRTLLLGLGIEDTPVTPADEPADDATRASWEDAARRWTHLGRRWSEPGATHSNR